MKLSWNEYFLNIAEAVALRSSCERSKVGAVIVDSSHRIVSTGYNDSAAGFPGCESCPRRTSSVCPGSSYDTGPGACVSLHAEQNAILYADRDDVRGSTIYITREPCGGCSKLMVGAGLQLAIWLPAVDGAYGYRYLQNKH